MPDWGTLLGDLSAAQAAVWIVAAVAVIGVVYKAWPVLRRFVDTVDALSDLPDFMQRIRHQVENDHTTNLREDVSEVLDTTKGMLAQIAALTEWQRKHEKKSDAAMARIDALEKKETS